MKTAAVLFPHQLFANHEIYRLGCTLFLVEEQLFFKEFNFHKTKLAFHRATMKYHESVLTQKGLTVHYIEATNARSDIRKLILFLSATGYDSLHFIDPTDNWLEKRLTNSAQQCGMSLFRYENPLFINSRETLSHFFKPTKKTFFQTSFYKEQRIQHRILIDEQKNPMGGKWSFDAENRKKYPKNKHPPSIQLPDTNAYWEEAIQYVQKNFGTNLGELCKNPIYPFTHEATQDWLHQFFENRFHGFGDFEDAIVKDAVFLHHSVLTPMLNIGLIRPTDVLQQALSFGKTKHVPLNTVEGFVRQILGWREFMRGMYECKGTVARNANFWGFTRKIPTSFYNGTTGIDPVDNTIKKVLQYGYCHHIERLMILGNFMLLCEFHPNEVYRWFMEFFVDGYDWVMVPNVYGMSQFADGGLFATKPYISGSNYILKMSNYPKGEWQMVWDGLFWRFIQNHRDFFTKNPRLSMLLGTWNNMPITKQNTLLSAAEVFLEKLEQPL
ncbi:cryptochrome/photolyase family protein [Arenibacter sp. GZD96]|uniref:cryptochrome/photolyase family protein n=1 Tax=Aurantibrevibacter litoralis TaxID=3106030 RepID=UPI002B003545|nr:cryptochrome/photolyase family protein [Arenibacter sp. GZD-96]MEA1785175.1 cryptochrome/photolyase family protein [Arenibacter sp. GZD-96]